MGRITEELNFLTANFSKTFEEQRRAIGAAYACENEIIILSKAGIAALKKGNAAKIEEVKVHLQEAWAKLGGLNLPDDIAWQHDAEAGQEYLEFLLVEKSYNYVINDGEIGEFFGPDEEGLKKVTPQIYLAGLGDAVGELGKIVDDRLLVLTNKAERQALRGRFLELAGEIHDYLDQFETVYAMVINNSRRRGYGNTYRGLLGRVRGAIRRQKEALIGALDRS